MSEQESPQHFIDIEEVQALARSLGFASLGFAALSKPLMAEHAQGLRAWLDGGNHGEDYRPLDAAWQAQAWQRLEQAEQAYVSCYALGRDYHKIVRGRLQKLADALCAKYGDFAYRAFCDSAPVMELPLAAHAGLGWRGKHTLLLNREHGSMFFIGSLYTNLTLPPLAVDDQAQAHCGSCTQCIDVCPTAAIIAPNRLDARRCISYLTIEHSGAIALEFREAIGNRIYGCDDCQLICPWNKFAQAPLQADIRQDFAPRHGLDRASLLQLWSWTEQEFLRNTEGSAIRRIGFWRWRRNLVIAMGNALRQSVLSGEERLAIKNALGQALQRITGSSDEVMQEHLSWALLAPASKE
jgi:epoxyqueuosine reductase